MIIPPRFAAYPQCEDALWRNVQQAMTGDISPADAIRRAAADIQGIVATQPPSPRLPPAPGSQVPRQGAGVTFDGKTVLVTGAAKGIGHAVARAHGA